MGTLKDVVAGSVTPSFSGVVVCDDAVKTTTTFRGGRVDCYRARLVAADVKNQYEGVLDITIALSTRDRCVKREQKFEVLLVPYVPPEEKVKPAEPKAPEPPEKDRKNVSDYRKTG